MINAAVMLYGVLCYAFSMAMLVLFILFANNHLGVLGIPAMESLNIDQPHGELLGNALLVNLGLLLLFGIQHSVMARGSFKAMLTRLLPESAERSTYILATGIVLWFLVGYWQPMPELLWQVQGETARLVINIVYYLGWLITVLATFMLNHFHLFGLQQSFRPDDPDAGMKEFRTPGFYRLVRHPIQTGVVIAMLATPDWSVGRAVLAGGMLLYVLVGLIYEERDLIAHFGDTYRDYRKRVPAVLPWPKKGGQTPS